jgi:hypothetical protein
MSTLGIVENVERTRYLDEVENSNVYPLDEKIQLLKIQGRYSRYTGNFASLAAEYYGRLPEREALGLLKRTLNIELEQDSLTSIGSAVAEAYLPKLYDEVEYKGAQPQAAATEPGFIEKRMQEIEASPDRDAIILKALEEGVEGTERKRIETDMTVAYVEADGTGVSGLPRELSDKGRDGGSAKTFEVKVGVIFNQSFDSGKLPLLNNGNIFRDPHSTRYMGTVEKVSQFTMQLDDFAKMNGIGYADQIVYLSDGAVCLEKLREKLYPCSIGIVDLYHARQHLRKLVESLRFHSKHRQDTFYEECSHLLDLGEIDKMIALVSHKAIDSNRASIEKQLEYFTGNKRKMRYGLFRAAGLFIGSGVIESACKTIVENRLNGSGMRWTKKNAANVVALRSAFYSGSYDQAA